MLSSSYYGGVVMNKDKIHVLDFLMIALGCAFYGYGLVNVNIANNLAEGGVTGVTLIIRYWLHIDPAYTTVLINVPSLSWQKIFTVYRLRNAQPVLFHLAVAACFLAGQSQRPA